MPVGALVAAALTVLAVAWTGPLASAATHSFAAHMAAHMLVVVSAAPLLALALMRHPRSARLAQGWLSPLPASLVELVTVWVWHTPRLHHAARTDVWAYLLEQTSFLAAGLVLWLAVVAAATAHRGRSAGPAVIALLLTLAHMTLLGALLALSPRALYAHGDLADQHRGGAVMLVGSLVAYGWAGLAVSRRLVTSGPALAGGRS